MTRHYPDLGSASGWLNQISHAARPIRSTAQIWVVTRHQYGISALVSQTSFGGETSGSVAKCRPFSQAKFVPVVFNFELLISANVTQFARTQGFAVIKKRSDDVIKSKFVKLWDWLAY